MPATSTDTKPIWASKTFWANLITVVVTVATSLTGVLPAEYTPFVTVALGIANVVLRFLTEKPVTI